MGCHVVCSEVSHSVLGWHLIKVSLADVNLPLSGVSISLAAFVLISVCPAQIWSA